MKRNNSCMGCCYIGVDFECEPCSTCKRQFPTSSLNYRFNDDKWCSSEESKEQVDHPAHYNREGSMECIDEMIVLFGKEYTKIFCIMNVWKYRYRAGQKGDGLEDLKKSDWYMKKYMELLKGSDNK